MAADELAGLPAGVDPEYYNSNWRDLPNCVHPKDALHVGRFQVTNPDAWRCDAVCLCCYAVFNETNIPDKVLGKIWLRQYEGRYGVLASEDPSIRERVARNVADTRSDMLAMIRYLGVDPANPDAH